MCAYMSLYQAHGVQCNNRFQPGYPGQMLPKVIDTCLDESTKMSDSANSFCLPWPDWCGDVDSSLLLKYSRSLKCHLDKAWSYISYYLIILYLSSHDPNTVRLSCWGLCSKMIEEKPQQQPLTQYNAPAHVTIWTLEIFLMMLKCLLSWNLSSPLVPSPSWALSKERR